MHTPPVIRPIAFGDADSVEQMYRQSAAHLRSVGDSTDFRFNADAYRRDGFGDRPAFAGIIAEVEGTPAGYLLYTQGYDTDSSTRFLFVIDLAVDERARRRGIGKAFMKEAASICREDGGGLLFWAVYSKNELALAFYRDLGAKPIVGGQFMTLAVSSGSLV
jgi:ribosomal protein S18 acetylase RimI-like enzyme